MTDIKVGDYVHYQPKPTKTGTLPMGVRNLKVLEVDNEMVKCEWEPFQHRLIVPLADCVKD